MLFSLVVLTYNQENFIEECLNSILLQGSFLANVQLIISDDKSQDSTQSKIISWLKLNESKFSSVIFNVNESNVGISENHLFGIKLAAGDLIKYIGGDDLLLPGALVSYANYFKLNSDVYCAVAGSLVLRHQEGRYQLEGTRPTKMNINFFDLSASQQFKRLSRENFIAAPGLCFRRDVCAEDYFLGSGFKRFEDWPTWLDMTRNGYKFCYIPTLCVIWRRHDSAVSDNPRMARDVEYYKNELQTIEQHILPYISGGSLLLKLSLYFKILEINILLRSNFSKYGIFLIKFLVILNVPLLIRKIMRKLR